MAANLTDAPLIDAPLIDARGMRCPWPVLRAAKALRETAAVTIVADDPLAASELHALATERDLLLSWVETALGRAIHLAPKWTRNT